LWRETYQKTKGSPLESNSMRCHSADGFRDYGEGDSYSSDDNGSERHNEGDIEEEEAIIDPTDLTGNINELFRHIYNEEVKQVKKFKDIVFP